MTRRSSEDERRKKRNVGKSGNGGRGKESGRGMVETGRIVGGVKGRERKGRSRRKGKGRGDEGEVKTRIGTEEGGGAGGGRGRNEKVPKKRAEVMKRAKRGQEGEGRRDGHEVSESEEWRAESGERGEEKDEGGNEAADSPGRAMGVKRKIRWGGGRCETEEMERRETRRDTLMEVNRERSTRGGGEEEEEMRMKEGGSDLGGREIRGAEEGSRKERDGKMEERGRRWG
ncbi:hypothetical protein Tco_0291395 [Tanacetum coccineum]